MHCASLGEFEQGRPLLEKLRKEYNQYAFVLTFFSPSGYEVRKDYEGADYIFYLPLDSVYNAKRFLAAVQPRLAIFVKYELWHFYLSQLARSNTPAILISAIFRKDQPFFKWYGRLHRRMLFCFQHIFVQNEVSMQLLRKIGIEDVSVAGDTRFDRVIEAAKHQPDLPQIATFSENARIIVAGSTWADDEEMLEKALSKLPQNWKLVIVPHEVHDSHIQEIKNRFSNAAVWSSWQDDDATKRVLIVDTVGLLLQLYRYADIAWVGGGFGSAGVHNVLEAAVYGIPVAFGPIYHQFAEAVEMQQTPAAISIDTPVAFAAFVSQMDKDQYSYERACEAASDYVQAHGGATGKIMHYLSEKNWFKTL
jgi:3-deoxy-D-manno-octulosonic-acid transferase